MATIPAPQYQPGGTPPRNPPSASSRVRRTMHRWVLLILMVVVAVVMLYPFWYIIDNAFRSAGQFDRQSGHSLSGWNQLFANLPVASELLNSTLVCIAAIAIMLVGLFLLPTNQRTITAGLATLSTGRTTSVPALMAGSLISAIPAIVVYLIFQRHLIKGLTLGMGK